MKNPEEKKIPLVEMFGPTVQGEGSVIGQQTFFLRFGLCDYDCKLCDSRHAVDPVEVKKGATWITQQEIYNQFRDFANDEQPYLRWVTFSGGNPCIHDLSLLVYNLKMTGYKIAVETQGTFKPDWLQKCDIITCSPKAPGIGEKFERSKFRQFFDIMHHRPGFNIKIVVFNEEDLEFAKQLIQDYPWIQYNPDKFYLSQGNPFIGQQGDYANLTQELRLKYLELLGEIQQDPILCQVKFLPQFHVWLWGNKKGV